MFSLQKNFIYFLTVNYRTNWNMDLSQSTQGGSQRGSRGGGWGGGGAARGEGCWGLEVGGCIEGVLEEGLFTSRG
jgi:hypothetical protein